MAFFGGDSISAGNGGVFVASLLVALLLLTLCPEFDADDEDDDDDDELFTTG